MRRTIVASFLLLSTTLHAADPTDPDARLLRLERWIKAALSHHPGQKDDATTEVGLWSNAQLRVLKFDQLVLTRVLRRPDLRVPAKPSDNPAIPPYTAWQFKKFNELTTEYRGRNVHNDIIVRGALLHGDVAMSNPPAAFAAESPVPGENRIKILVGDGESLGLNGVPVHWDMARTLFDAVKDDPQAADIARRWYIATATLMQNLGQHDTLHLQHGRDMFPADVSLQFLSGCQLEAYASAPIQAAARTAVLPTGYRVDVPPESSALKGAEDFLRRALMLDPQHPLARLRLGHVLLARGRWQEAADELRKATFPASERDRRYFTALFLGAAEEGAGRFDEARDAYVRASTLVPLAQSPYVALSALAARRGDRATALQEIQHVFDLTMGAEAPSDPWWEYQRDHTRDVDALFEMLYASVGDARR
jgi:tetratricopeptide (TPR) repeat protein